METFVIHDLLTPVGEICMESSGLYYIYDACISVETKSICRCHYHLENLSVSLGVFVPDGGAFRCSGRIARKQLPENLADGQFSILNQQWRPLLSEDGRAYAAQCARGLTGDAVRKIAILRYGEFPKQLLPLFCFFQPEQIGMHKCLTLQLDEEGRPVKN